MKKVFFVLLIGFIGNSYGSDCEDSINKMEDRATPQSEKKALALKAVKDCKNEKVINPQIMLAYIGNSEENFAEAVKWNDEAIKIAPGSPLPYMNKCASLMGWMKFDEAIEACQKGLDLKLKDPKWNAKLNANLALAMYKKGVQENDNSVVSQSEKYFKESSLLDPSIAQNHNYLGIISFYIKKNVPEATTYYKKACDLGDPSGCKNLKDAEAASSTPVVSKKDSGPVSTDEKELYKKIRQGYLKTGVPAESVNSIIENITKSLVQLTPEQRIQSLQNMVKALE